ncbi:MAG: autotransporter-associated beta strand repeat-containing protein, partial [Planctomycetaceae bacterium]|nr:autotransporter-associated beta strand repeat-containing protein [Planctomycetaceae bacterium]
FLNAAGNNYNAIVLRPGGQILINDVAGQVAGGEGRWDDTAPLKLNGGTFRFEQVNASAFVNGALNTRSYEAIGSVEANKGGALRVVRVNGSAGSASLVLGGLTRGAGQDRGTLLVTNSQAIIGGTPTATSSVFGIISAASGQAPSSYDRLIVAGGAGAFGGLTGKTNIGASVTASYATNGVAPLWMVDATNHSYLTYNPAGGAFDGDTGFQTLLNTPSPGVGQVSYSNLVLSGGTVPVLSAGSVVDIGTFFVGGGAVTNASQSVNVTSTANLVVGMPITGTGIPAGTTITSINSATNITISAQGTATNTGLTLTANGTGVTLGSNPTLYAMRLGQNLNPSGSNNTINFSSGTAVAAGGILFNNTTGTATISTQTANSVTNPMTLAFGANEAIIYVASGGTGTINAQITGSGGLTKFGAGSLILNGSNSLTGGIVVHNGGLLQLNNPVAADGTTISNAIGNRDIVLNGNGAGTGTGQAGTTTLTLDFLLASSTAGSIAGNRDSLMASGSRITGFLNNTIYVNGDSVINNAGSAVYQRINNLTFATLTEVGAAGGSNARSLVQANFNQAGIRVSGTTTLGANSNAMNVAFSGMGMVMLDGPVSGGAGGRLIKTGNGMLFFNNSGNTFGADGKVGLEVWASTQNTATSIVGSTLRGAGSPFGVGDINLLPGTMIRLAAASNISGQKVYSYSDNIGISGVSFAYHTSPATKGLSQADIMNVLTNTPTDGKVSLESTGGYLGVVALDNGWQYNALDMGAMETALGGKLWLGSSTSNQVYFAPTLQPGADNVYRLGGGGNQGSLIVGLNAFENVLTGNRSVVVGANDFGFNAVSYVNGNSSVTLRTRNNFTGDITAERDSTLNIENSFALGTGKLLANQASDVTAGGGAGGLLQTNNGAVAINNNVDVIGDLRWSGASDFVIRGDVNLTPTGVGGTRVLQVGVSGAAVMSILGVVSGDRSNLVKSGTQTLVLNNPNNSYSGTTQLAGTGGNLLVGADVLPNQLSPLGRSDSPVIITASSTTINAVGLGLSGQVTFGRDIVVQNSIAASFAGVFGNTIYTSRVTGNIAVVATGADRDLLINSVANGRLEMLGAITSNGGSMRVRMGDTGTTRVGVVYLGPGPNGTSLNSYQGNTILDNGRIIVGANSQYTGATNNLAITSSPFGTGSIMLGSTTNGTSVSADGVSRIIPNALSAIAVGGNSTIAFFGRGDLSFISTGTGGTTTSWDLNTNGALRNRTFNVNTSMGAVSFATNYTTNNGAFGANLFKTGPGVLVMNGASTAYNEVTTDGNYGTSWFINAGVLRVSADASLGDSAVIAKGTGGHALTGQASDVRLGGGVLSVAGSFLTSHQFIQTAASTIEVSAGNTLTQSYRVTGAFGLTKIGAGTLMLNATANANTSLAVGNFNGGGGTVATQASTGNPFGTASAAVTLNGGALRLLGVTGTAPGGVTVGTAQGDASFVLNVSSSAGIVPGMTVAGTNIPAGTIVTGVDGNTIRLSNASTADVATGTSLTFGLQAQDLSVNTLNYAAAAGIELVKGTGVATSTLRITNVFARQTYGMLTLTSSNLSSDLGVNERLFATNPPANLSGGAILSVPSIVGRSSSGADLNFLKYDAATGFRQHTAATVSTLGTSAATSVAEITSSQAVTNGPIDVFALRTNSNVTGSSLLRIASGGIIFNGVASPTISAPLRFGTLANTPQEALVWVSNTTGVSTISGGFTATDFTKAGPGTLLISGTNVMAPLSDAQRTASSSGTTVTVADTTDLSVGMTVTGFTGTIAGTTSVITNILSPTQFTVAATLGTHDNITVSGLRRVTIQDGTLRFASQSSVPSGGNVIIAVNNAGVFDLNNQNLNIGGLNGTGTVTNSGGSLRTLSVNMDLSQVLAFNGQITGNLALEKTGIGTLTIAPPMNKDGASFGNTYTGGTTVNAGQIVGAHIFAPSSLGTLSVQNVMGLGTGDITLKGGILDFSMTGTGTLGYVGNEIVDAISAIQVGPNNGYNIVVPRLNNFGTLNTTSAIGTTIAGSAWAKINDVTLDAPSLTWVGQATNVMVDGTFNVTYDDGDAGTLYDEVFLNTAGSGVIAGQILAENKTLVKAGAGTLFLTNGQTGDLRNKVHQWKIMAGALELRIANGASSPLGSAAEINMNNSTLNVRLEGDNTTAMQVLTTFADNSILVGTQVGIASRSYLGSGNTVLSTDRLGSGANKTVVFKDLNFGGALGSPYFSYNSGNGYTTIFSNLTMVKDAYLAVNNLSMTVDGGISGAGTLYKQGGAALFVNSANPGFKGGTVVSQGTLFFGKFEGVVTTLNDTANVGTGNILVNPGAAVQFNSITNVVAGWTGLLDVRSNAMGNYGIVRLAADETLDAFHFRLGNLGGPQTTSYFGLAGGLGLDGLGKNVGAAIIALNTVYTKAIDMRRIGDGTAYLGSTSNQVGQVGSYNAPTLGVGAGNTYRLGAGNSTLYVQSTMAANNVLTGAGANLVVGLIHSGMNVDNINGGNGRGTVVLMTDNNYTGSTTVNRGSTLEFRGALTSSSFETWGLLTAAGFGGTFVNATSSANLGSVTTRPGSEIRFDNSSGLLPTSAAQGRWFDSAALTLDNSILRIIGNRDVETSETVGMVTVVGQGTVLAQRDYPSRQTALVLGGITAGANATLSIQPATGAQLGNDERVLLSTDTAGLPDIVLPGQVGAGVKFRNGMIAPWIVNIGELQFLTYTADNGFVNAGFNRIRTGALGTTSSATERVFINAASTISGGAGNFDVYALRLDGDVTFLANTTAAASDRITILSGAVLANGTRTFTPGLQFGATGNPTPAYIVNNGTFTIGDNTLPTTTGQLTNASTIYKTGAGTLQIDAAQPNFTGNWIVNQGSLFLRSRTAQSNLGGAASGAQLAAFSNGVVQMNAFDTTLGLRPDVAGTVFNVSLVLGPNNPQVRLTADRGPINTASSVLAQLGGSIKFAGSPGEQGQTLFITSGNSYTLQVNGGVDLGPAGNAFIRTDVVFTVQGKLTGSGTLVKTGGSTLDLNGITPANGVNDNTGGIQMVLGTLNVRGGATTANAFPAAPAVLNYGGFGSGAFTVWGGTTNIRIDGSNNTTRERYWVGNNAAGNSLIVNGSATIDINRQSGAGTTKHMAFKDLTIGGATLGLTGGNSYVFEINGGTTLVGSPVLNVSSAQLFFNGAVSDGGAKQIIVKNGGESLWFNGTSSRFGGLLPGTYGPNGLGLVVNGGLLRFGDVATETPTLNLSTMLNGSRVRVNPTGNWRLMTPNVAIGVGQIQQYSVAPQLSLFRLGTAAVSGAQIQSWFTTDSSGVLALENTTHTAPLNLAAIGDGTFRLGAVGTVTYNPLSLGVGAGNLYRIGGAGATLTLDSSGVTTGALIESAPGTRVEFGSQGVNGGGAVVLNDLNTYTGGSVISRGMAVTFQIAPTAVAGAFGNGGSIDVFGTLVAQAAAGTFQKATLDPNSNAYNVRLHPGAILRFNNSATNSDRWADNVAISLDGATLNVAGAAAVAVTEVVGAVSFQRGAGIQINRNAAATAQLDQLTVASLSRGGAGATLTLSYVAGSTGLGIAGGGTALAGERLIVSSWAQQMPQLYGSVNSGAGAPTGILPGYYIDGTSNTFLSYNAATGFQSLLSTASPAAGAVAYSKIINFGDISTVDFSSGQDTLDVNGSAFTIVRDFAVFAMRSSVNITSGVGQYNTITFSDAPGGGRGGLITTGAIAVQADLKFGNAGLSDAYVYNTTNLTINGDIYASSVTKFGAGNMILAKDQTAQARAGVGLLGNWYVNQGTLQLNTFGASGNGRIFLNASGQTSGAGTTLNLSANSGSPLSGTYTMSGITIVDNALINVDAGGADRTVTIGDLEVVSTDLTGLQPARARFVVAQARSMVNAGVLTLSGVGTSIIDVNANNVNNQITSGATAGVAVAGLVGSQNLIKWGNGGLYLRGDNSATFTGDVVIEQGALRVTEANALGNAATDVTVRRYGTFDLWAAGVAKVPTYEAGAIERWSIDGARNMALLNLGAGTLQVNADQFSQTNTTVRLNGGAIEGYLRTDDSLDSNIGVVYRTLGAGVKFELLGDSFVGQNPLIDGPNGLDNGRPNDLQPGLGAPGVNNSSSLTDSARGVILEIKGVISGTGGLTKQSGDTVILSGVNTYQGATNITGGTLRVGIGGALPSQTNLTTYGSGVLDLSGNNVTVGGLSAAVVGGAQINSSGFITNSATTLNTFTVGNGATADFVYGGVIQNNVSLVKSGSNKQTLTNVNTYYGETTVSGGALTVTHVDGTGNVDGVVNTTKLSVGSGAAFNILTGATTGSNLTLAPTAGTVLDLANNSRLGFQLSGVGGASSGKITLQAGALAHAVGNVFIDAYFNSTYTPVGSVIVINAPSGGLRTTNGSSATYQIGNIFNGTGANFTVTGIVQSDTQVALTTAAGGTSAALFWKGGLSGATNVWAATNGTSQSNWATDSAGTNTPNIPTSGTAVTFSATGATNQGAMTLGGDVQMASLTINDTASVSLQDSAFSLTITGSSAITTGASAGTAALNVPLVLQNGTPTISLASANSLTLGGPISGAATTLTKAGTGAGSLILTGANTFAGAFNITTGVVRISNDSALGSTAGGTVVSSGATLEMLGGITVGAEALSLNGAGVGSNGALRNISGNNIYNGAVTLAGITTIQSDAGLLTLNGTINNGANLLTVQGAGNTTLTGVLGNGSGGLTKAGNGTLRVSAANTFTGAVNVNGGILTVANNTGLGTTAGGVTVTSGASLELQGNITVGAETLSLAGAGFASSGALRNLNGTNTYGGAVTLTADSTITSDLGVLTLDVASGNAIGGTFNLTFNGAGSITVADPIATSTGTLTKNGTGLLILSGANTYTGTTTVTDGIMRLANATALSGGIAAAGGTSGLTINGGGIVELGANDFSRGLGTGAANVQWTGSGGFGAFSAARTVNLGGSGAAVTWASGSFVPNASELVLSSTTSTHTVTFANPIALNGAVRTIRVNDGGAAIDAVISGAITGTSPAGLIKTGPGVLALNTGANSIGGPTTVQQGTLTVNSSLAGGGGVTVGSGARFNGGVAGTPASVTSPIAVQSGGSFSAGSSTNSATGDGVGQMNVALTSGQLVDWQSGSNLVFDFRTNSSAIGTQGTNWDYLNITGTGSSLKIGNGLTLLVNSWNDALTTYGQNSSATPANNFNPATSSSYSWLWVTAPSFLNASGNPIADGELSNFNIIDDTGTAVFSPTGGNYSQIGGSEFWVSKVGTGLYINYGIHAVPEPGSLMLMGLAGLGFGAYGWRRRKKRADAVDAATTLDENGKSDRIG